jgi:glucosylceramidase
VALTQTHLNHGVPIEAITPQNEPDGGSLFPGLQLDASTEAMWIVQDLQPALRAAGLHPKIYGYDGGGHVAYPHALLSSPARSALSGMAWHCYGGMDAMKIIHGMAPELDQIMSECSPGIVPYPVSEIAIGAVRDWASAVGLWNLALDPAGGPVQPPNSGCWRCTGLVTISEQNHTAMLGIGYYQLGQISEFVRPGAIRIRSERFVSDFHTPSGGYGITAGLDDVAFLDPDGERVLVAYDNSAAPVRFAVQWRKRSFAYTLAARATVTFTWRPPR